MSTNNEDKPFAEVTPKDVEAAGFQTLRRWSIAAGLGAAGKLVDLKKRLLIKLTSTPGEHKHGRTKCTICPFPAKVTGTKREKMADGRTLVKRAMRCEDRHHHTFTLKHIETPLGWKRPG